jgi:hypothetical protein
VKDFLLDKFAIIGDTPQLPVMELMLTRAYGIAGGEEKAVANKHAKDMAKMNKEAEQKTMAELFTKEQYRKMARRHSIDIELYYWALGQLEVLKHCFGVSELDETLCSATGTGCINSPTGAQSAFRMASPPSP